MDKINYQIECDKIIDSLKNKPSLLLHVCCAPCSSYVIEYLSKYFNIDVFYSNSNITEKDEFIKRFNELEKLKTSFDFGIIQDPLNSDEYFDLVTGYENEPEGGARCSICFNMRLETTAKYAKKHNYDFFATTLTVSPHKNEQLINSIGKKISEKYNIQYLPSDFKKRNGYKRSIELSKQFDLYRQIFCGCIFSKS